MCSSKERRTRQAVYCAASLELRARAALPPAPFDKHTNHRYLKDLLGAGHVHARAGHVSASAGPPPRTFTTRSSEVPIEVGNTAHLHFTSARPSLASFLNRVKVARPTGHMGSLCLLGSLSILPPVFVPNWRRSIRAFRHTPGTQFSDATHRHSTQSRVPATSGSTLKDAHAYSRRSTSNSPRIRRRE